MLTYVPISANCLFVYCLLHLCIRMFIVFFLCNINHCNDSAPCWDLDWTIKSYLILYYFLKYYIYTIFNSLQFQCFSIHRSKISKKTEDDINVLRGHPKVKTRSKKKRERERVSVTSIQNWENSKIRCLYF